MNRITLGAHVTLGLPGDGGRFTGIAEVLIDGLPMRSPRLPILPEIRTPEAVELCDWRELRREALPDGGVRLVLAPSRREGGLMEWMLHRVHNRYRVADWDAQPVPLDDTTLELDLRPVGRVLRGSTGRGFSYQYRYRSASLPIYKILDRASWEPGGAAVGTAFWLRNGTAPPICRIASREQHYSTEWYLPGCHNPSIFQFQPFQTQFCGFTMTTAGGGALVTWVDGVAHVRSLFEKRRGTDEILHLHEHCGDLGNELETRPVEVLWFAGGRDAVADANLWEAVRSHVSASLHAEIGMREERVDTYGVIEEWGMPDLEAYRREAVPALLAAGVKQVFIPNQFATNMNVWGLSNMCCTVDWRIAESVGIGPVKAFCDALHAGGATVHHWGNTALSTLAVIFGMRQPDGHQGRIRHLPAEGSVAEELRGHPQAWVRNPAGHYEADHYSPVFCQLNLREPAVRALWHRRWREAREQAGFDGLFLDSSFNMSSDKWHWVGQVAGHGGATIDQTHLLGHGRPAMEPPKAILSQYRAHLDTMVEMQAYGYHINGEDIGVFGSHRSGPAMTTRLDNLFMWNECLAAFDAEALQAAGAEPGEVFFDALAHRCMWMLHWCIPAKALSWRQDRADPADRPTAGQLALLQAFSVANPDMRGKTILPGGAGVLYEDGARRILWASRDLRLALRPGEQPCCLNGPTAETQAGMLLAGRQRVYRLS